MLKEEEEEKNWQIKILPRENVIVTWEIQVNTSDIDERNIVLKELVNQLEKNLHIDETITIGDFSKKTVDLIKNFILISYSEGIKFRRSDILDRSILDKHSFDPVAVSVALQKMEKEGIIEREGDIYHVPINGRQLQDDISSAWKQENEIRKD